MSQDEAASALEVARPVISQIEAGKRGVSGIELARLASLYGRPLASFFDEDFGDQEEDPLTILLRASQITQEDAQLVKEFAELCRAYEGLEELLGLDEDKSWMPDYGGLGEPRDKLEALRQGEKVAEEERRRLGLGDDPLRDVFELLEAQGVRLFVRPLRGSGVSGLFLYDRAIGPCILVNGAEQRSRLAFSASHEYAHVLLDRRLHARVSPFGRSEELGELLEVRANRFAAAFLMPAEGIERFLWDLGMLRDDRHGRVEVVDVMYMQRTFGVSYQAALYRLQSLGWLDSARRGELESKRRPDALAEVLGMEESEEELKHFDNEAGYPLRYKYLALEAYQREKISITKLADLLKVPTEEAEMLALDLQ